MVTETKPQFETEDGQTFDTELKATQHEEVQRITAEYESARKHYDRMLLATQRTADGQPFDITNSRTFYYVQGIHSPWVVEVDLSWWTDLSVDEKDCASIRTVTQNVHSPYDTEVKYYKIGDLYASRAAAVVACADRLSELAEQMQEHAAKLRGEES